MRFFASLLILLGLVNAAIAQQQTQSFSDFINGLPAATPVAPTDYLYLLQGGASKKLPASALPSFNTKAQAVNPVDYGADPTGAADSLPALNHALTISANVLFPPGKFRFSGPVNYTIPCTLDVLGVHIAGSGPEVTRLFWPLGGGIKVTYACAANNSGTFDNFTCTTGLINSGTCITAIRTDAFPNNAVQVPSKFQNIVCRGDDGVAIALFWNTCISLSDISNVTFEHVYATGVGPDSGGIGVTLSGNVALPGPTTGVVYNFANCIFNAMAVGLNIGSYIQGIAIVNTNFTDNNKGIYVASDIIGFAGQLSISSSQFGVTSPGTTGIDIQGNYDIVEVSATTFINAGDNLGIGINLKNYQRAQVVGNTFVAPGAGTAVNVAGTNDLNPAVVISGNTFFNYTAALNISIDAKNVNVNSNIFTGNNSAIVNFAPTTVITNNIGYNPVGIFTDNPYPQTSTTTYANGPSPATHYFSGGTDVSVKIPDNTGAVVCSATPCALYLGPNETMAVVYTVAPVHTRSVH